MVQKMYSLFDIQISIFFICYRISPVRFHTIRNLSLELSFPWNRIGISIGGRDQDEEAYLQINSNRRKLFPSFPIAHCRLVVVRDSRFTILICERKKWKLFSVSFWFCFSDQSVGLGEVFFPSTLWPLLIINAFDNRLCYCSDQWAFFLQLSPWFDMQS